MQRTFNFSDKYNSLIREYDKKYDKKELDVLVVNLLKANKNLKDKDIDLLLIADLIVKFDVNLYSLIAAITGVCDSSNTVKSSEPLTTDDESTNEDTIVEDIAETQIKKNPILTMGNLSK